MSLSAVALIALAAGGVWAQGPLVFERLVDSSTPIPGGETNFFLDNVTPAPCDLGIVFAGADISLVETGIYRASGAGISVIADESSTAPGGGFFDRLEDPACSGTRVAFLGIDSSSGLRGAFAWSAGSLETLALQGDPAPGGGTFSSVSRAAVTSGAAAFTGTVFPPGIFAMFYENQNSGGMVRIVDTTSPVPGVPGETFDAFTPPALSSDLLAFRGIYGIDEDGIYEWSDGQLGVVADEQTPVPGRPGVEFVSSGTPSVWSDRVVFTAVHPQGRGIYGVGPEGLTELFAPGAPAPGGGIFLDYDRPVAGPRGIAFFALTSTDDRALFLLWDDELRRIIGTLDTLDGQRAFSFNYALGERALAFRTLFEDSSQAIYRVPLAAQPIPALSAPSLALLALLLALAGKLLLARRRTAT